MKLFNAFSLGMVKLPSLIDAREISLEEARKLIDGGVESFVGHENTAAVFSNLLGVDVTANRGTVSLENDLFLVGQYNGPRLPEGAVSLPEGATIKWILVSVS